MGIAFETFRKMLLAAINDTGFIARNTLLQDSALKLEITDRITSLTPDFNVEAKIGDVSSVIGMLKVDNDQRALFFEPRGFSIALSNVREGTIQSPRRVWQRNDSVDTIRYLLSDEQKGVLMLNSECKLVRIFPGFNNGTPSSAQYSQPTAVVTFTIASTEYLAITCLDRHCVQIYNLSTEGFVATIGTIGVAGANSTHLSSPNGVAYDSTSTTLYISNLAGIPSGATAPGFIARWDVSTPGVPTFTDIPFKFATTGDLLVKEVDAPTSVFVDLVDRNLWITNGNDQVGAFAIANNLKLIKFLEATGPNYTMAQPSQIRIRTIDTNTRRVYIANGAYGRVEIFDHTSMKLLNSLGVRSSEDTLSSVNQLSQYIFGAIGFCEAGTPDTVDIDGVSTNVVIVSDSLNRRVQRFNEDAFGTTNLVTFNPVELTVPVRLRGWSVNGDIPTSMIVVQYKASSIDSFHNLDSFTDVPPSSYFQFRIQVKLSTAMLVRNYLIKSLIVLGVQA